MPLVSYSQMVTVAELLAMMTQEEQAIQEVQVIQKKAVVFLHPYQDLSQMITKTDLAEMRQ